MSPNGAEDGFHLRDSELSAESPVFDLSPEDFSALLHTAG